MANVEAWEKAHASKQSAPTDDEADAILLADAMREIGDA